MDKIKAIYKALLKFQARKRLTSRVVAQVAQMRQQMEYAAAAAAAGGDQAQYAAMGNGPQ